MREPERFVEKYGPWALIAGAGEGIGAELADQLGMLGLNLIAVDHNPTALDAVTQRVRERREVEVRPIAVDLTDRAAGATIASESRGCDVGLVIYVAGSANHTREFLDVDLEYSLSHVALACAGPVELVRRFGPAMKLRGHGGIVLVGSLACMAGAAHLAVYAAVKAFDVTFAEGLWAELRPHGVDVCAALLGPTYTETNRRLGVEYNADVDMLPSDIVPEIIEHIDDGPTFVVGAANRAVAAQLWTPDRRALVELLSAGSTSYATTRARS